MLNWKFLKKGDIVDVVAPGFRSTDEEFNRGVKYLESIGLKPRVPKNLYGEDVICSNRDEVRLEHLRKALQVTDSKAVWCMRGGYGSLRLLPLLKKIKKPKTAKLFVGYSDLTTIHTLLNFDWGWATIHGPVLERMGSEHQPQDEKKCVENLIFGREESLEFKNLEPLNVAAKSARVLKAPVVGGNLAVLVSSLGTPWQRNPEGKFLFIEDIGERGYRIDRMLTQLELAGYFKGVKGLFLGTFTGGEEADGTSKVWPVIERFSKAVKFPVFKGLTVGHGERQMPLPFGVEAVYEGKSLTVSSGGQKK